MKNFEKYIGKRISSAAIIDDVFVIKFEDRTKIGIADHGQSCCEDRFMTTDDDVTALAGTSLISIEEKPGPDVDDDNNCHEICFVEIQTDRISLQLVNHNIHSGYYGGFNMKIKELPSELIMEEGG